MSVLVFRKPSKQLGAAAVEFALIALVFFMLLLGIVELGRVLFTWNAAVEATRYGARVAVVCNPNSPAILSSMRRIMPNLSDANVVKEYLTSTNSDCSSSPDTCHWVRISIQGLSVTTHIPLANMVLGVPQFTTTLPRESLNSVNNPVCS